MTKASFGTWILFTLIWTSSVNYVAAQNEGAFADEKTWTYTYIKAVKNQKDDLKRFIELNWFAMDSVAVSQGLFNDYLLLENSSTEDSTSWDFIVAVEYFTRGAYADIESDWLVIRQRHKKVLVKGLDFPDLGRVVKTEHLVKHSYRGLSDN